MVKDMELLLDSGTVNKFVTIDSAVNIAMLVNLNVLFIKKLLLLIAKAVRSVDKNATDRTTHRSVNIAFVHALS